MRKFAQLMPSHLDNYPRNFACTPPGVVCPGASDRSFLSCRPQQASSFLYFAHSDRHGVSSWVSRRLRVARPDAVHRDSRRLLWSPTLNSNGYGRRMRDEGRVLDQAILLGHWINGQNQ